MQNREEISTWQRFPDRVKAAEPPVVVPVRDWAEDNLWLSMPLVEEGGSGREVENQLARLGWSCEDIHHANVGNIHGHSVILDFGFSCHEVDRPGEIAQEVRDRLDNLGAHSITTGGSHQGSSVSFLPPEWIGDDEPPQTESSVSIDAVDGVVSAAVAFGAWPAEDSEMLGESMERVADEIEDEWRSVHVRTNLITNNGTVEIAFEMNIERGMDAWTFGDLYDDVLGWVDEHIDSAMDPEPIAEEIEAGLGRVGVDPSPDDDIGGRRISIRFKPDDDTIPGFQTPGFDSWIAVDTSGFDEMRVVVGPYRQDEPGAWDRVPEGANAIIDALAAKQPDMDISWTKLDAPGTTPGGESRLGEVQISLAAMVDTPAEDLTPGEIVGLYQDVIELANQHLPPARREGDPVQSDLDEFQRRLRQIRLNARTRGDIASAARRGLDRR